MDIVPILERLGVALGLGLLVGLQRQRTEAHLAGFRTFPLVTVFGSFCALLGETCGGWVVGLGLLALAIVILVGNLGDIHAGRGEPGMTTEAALLLMFAVGAYLAHGSIAVALTVGGSTAVLLHLKTQLHEVAAKIGDRDFKAVMQFVVISLVIQPVLPNRFYGPYAVLNPHRIWLMLVLIVAISLSGYVIYRLFGQRAGILTSGILGGLISSTATTVSYSRRSRETPVLTDLGAVIVMIATAVLYFRILLIIGSTAPGFLPHAVWPIGLMFAATSLIAWRAWRANRREPMPAFSEQSNPTELKTALMFAAAYSAVLVGIAAAREYLGQSGLYVVGALSGLTDMDAIALSMGELVTAGKVEPQTGWRVIIVASLSNLVFKTAVIAMLGTAQLLRRIAVWFAAAFAAGTMLVAFWPA
jgi:uncharacterized membrane protein (DUF4010 family)